MFLPVIYDAEGRRLGYIRAAIASHSRASRQDCRADFIDALAFPTLEDAQARTPAPPYGCRVRFVERYDHEVRKALDADPFARMAVPRSAEYMARLNAARKARRCSN